MRDKSCERNLYWSSEEETLCYYLLFIAVVEVKVENVEGKNVESFRKRLWNDPCEELKARFTMKIFWFGQARLTMY